MINELTYTLPWQCSVWNKFLFNYEQNLLAHTYLCCGIEGIGKYFFIKKLASYLLCQDKKNSQSCSICKGCNLFESGTHPDFFLLEAIGSNSSIKIDEIRLLISQLQHKSHQSGYRVIVINRVENININAANALLKILEEPPEKTIFFLITARLGAVIPTILSRCQKIIFPSVSKQYAIDWLSKHFKSENIELALNLSQNAPLKARELLLNQGIEIRKDWIDGIKSLFKGISSATELAKKFETYDALVLISYLVDWLEESIKIKLASRDYKIRRNKDIEKVLYYISYKSNIKKMFIIRSNILNKYFSIQNGKNLNSLLALESSLCLYLELIL